MQPTYKHTSYLNGIPAPTLRAIPAYGLVTITECSQVFAHNLRCVRHFLKLTQQQLADKLEIKQRTLAAYEEGRADPPMATLVKMARAFGVQVDDLLAPKGAR